MRKNPIICVVLTAVMLLSFSSSWAGVQRNEKPEDGSSHDLKLSNHFNSRLLQLDSELKQIEVGGNLRCDTSRQDLLPQHKRIYAGSLDLHKLLSDLKMEIQAAGLSLDDADYKAKMDRADSAKQKAFEHASRERLCLYKMDLDRNVRALIADAKNEHTKEVKDLSKILDCLSGARNDLRPSSKDGFAGFFEGLFNQYWNKDKLTDDDCKVLESAYGVWASFYDSDNQSAKENVDHAGAIPIYNVNDHNASFYAWAAEQRKGRIPPHGASLVHVDTHTDMGHVHNHLSRKHWIGTDIKIDSIQKALIQDDRGFVADLLKAVSTNAKLSPEVKAKIQGKISDTNPKALREDLTRAMEMNVQHIATALAAAHSTDVANGNLHMVMPSFTDELPLGTREGCLMRRGGADSFEIKSDHPKGYLLVEFDKKTNKEKKWNLPVSNCKSSNDDPAIPTTLLKPISLSVTHSYDDQTQSWGGGLQTTVDVKAPEKPFYSNFTAKDRGYILDLDLDTFASNGVTDNGQPFNVEPLSPGRAQHIAEFNEHDDLGHGRKNKFVEADEFFAIKKRMDVFFGQLKDAKKLGYEPSVITISDSTKKERAIMERDHLEAQGKWNPYTPVCLAFLLNYMAKKELKRIFD